MKTQFKKNAFMAVCATATLFASCSKDGPEPEEPAIEPVVLDCSTITQAMLLENRGSGVDYIWPCMVKVEAPLTIEAGVTIAFEQGGGLAVSDYGSRTGALTAIGTADKPIVFTGTQNAPGAWDEILISSKSLNNKLHHCVIEYAGTQNGSKPAVTVVSGGDGSKIEIQHTTIQNSRGNGLRVEGLATIEGWKANTFNKNQGYPIQIPARKIKFLDGTQSTYTENGKNQIYVNTGGSNRRSFIEDEVGGPVHTWLDAGIPYFIEENVLVRQDRENNKPGHLKIMEGCDIIFAEEYGIEVSYNNTVLEILGSSSNPVKFSGQQGPGSWKGIHILESNSSQNKIENTTIADAGQSAWLWFGKKGGLTLGGQMKTAVRLSLTNLHITNSAGCGIVEKLNSGANITYTNITYSDNAGGDICEVD